MTATAGTARKAETVPARPLRGLYVTSQWPGAETTGAQQRIFNIGSLLTQVCDLDLMVVDRYNHEAQYRASTERMFRLIKVIPLQSHDRGLTHRLRHEFDPAYPLTSGFVASPADQAFVTNLLPQYDFVWIYKIETANAVGLRRWPRTILDIDDRPSQVYATRASTDQNLWSRLLSTRSRFLWSRRERALQSRFDQLLVSSEEDKRAFGVDSVLVMPNGFHQQPGVSRAPWDPPRLGFVGTFDWWPNADGMRWFMEQVWHSIREHVPNASLRVIGKQSEQFSDATRCIEGLGFVEDAAEEMSTWSGMIVPIRGGGGTRIKVLEAFARGIPTVSTSFGVYGYDLTDGKELFIADDAATFATRCIQLLESPVLGRTIAARARDRFMENWTWESYLPRVRSIIEQVVEQRSPR